MVCYRTRGNCGRTEDLSQSDYDFMIVDDVADHTDDVPESPYSAFLYIAGSYGKEG